MTSFPPLAPQPSPHVQRRCAWGSQALIDFARTQLALCASRAVSAISCAVSHEPHSQCWQQGSPGVQPATSSPPRTSGDLMQSHATQYSGQSPQDNSIHSDGIQRMPKEVIPETQSGPPRAPALVWSQTSTPDTTAHLLGGGEGGLHHSPLWTAALTTEIQEGGKDTQRLSVLRDCLLRW